MDFPVGVEPAVARALVAGTRPAEAVFWPTWGAGVEDRRQTVTFELSPVGEPTPRNVCTSRRP